MKISRRTTHVILLKFITGTLQIHSITIVQRKKPITTKKGFMLPNHCLQTAPKISAQYGENIALVLSIIKFIYVLPHRLSMEYKLYNLAVTKKKVKLCKVMEDCVKNCIFQLIYCFGKSSRAVSLFFLVG